MCESPTHHPVRLNVGREQQLPCEVSSQLLAAPALNMSDSILHSPAQTERARSDLKHMGSIIHQEQQGVGIQHP